jgi:gluconate transporter
LTVVAVVLLIALLILLISGGRVPPFAAFIATALVAALCFGMPLHDIGKSLERGVGDMLGGLAAIICLGAMFGRTIADSGAARSIANTLIGVVGVRFISIAMALTGLIVGIPLFYSVGFVILIPLVFSLCARTKLPLVYLGIPLLCGLSVAHGFLPPHPSPIALVKLFGADMGLTLIYGTIVGGVTVMIAGPMLALTLKGIAPQRVNQRVNQGANPGAGQSAGQAAGRVTASSSGLSESSTAPEERLPGSLNSCSTALLPVALIAATTAIAYVPHGSPQLEAVAAFIGQPAVALLVSLIYATFSLGVARGKSFKTLMQAQGASLQEVSGILLILAGAGALKQVFVDGGVSAQLAAWLQTVPLQPLILGWLIAVAIRIALGSATIAGLTAAGIMAPVVAASGVDPNLMVLSIGAGSLMFSHVNDAGFWMFKEYFNLSLRDTFRSWTLMESLAGAVGLLCVLALNLLLPGVDVGDQSQEVDELSLTE